MTLKDFRYLVFHHSAGSRKTTADDIDAMHRAKGWSGAGYSYVIEGDGRLVVARGLRRVLAANPPQNGSSIAVCIVGNNQEPEHYWNEAQVNTARSLTHAVRFLVPDIEIVGHQDIGSTPTLCPCIERGELERMMI